MGQGLELLYRTPSWISSSTYMWMEFGSLGHRLDTLQQSIPDKYWRSGFGAIVNKFFLGCGWNLDLSVTTTSFQHEKVLEKIWVEFDKLY